MEKARFEQWDWQAKIMFGQKFRRYNMMNDDIKHYNL
jgi:hypothetical protein